MHTYPQSAPTWITQFYLQTTPCLPFLHKRSPDGATTTEAADIQLQLYYSFIDAEGMKGWVGLIGWHIADGLPTQVVVTHQLQVKRRTAKVHRPETDVIPQDHATNREQEGWNDKSSDKDSEQQKCHTTEWRQWLFILAYEFSSLCIIFLHLHKCICCDLYNFDTRHNTIIKFF